MPAHPPSTGALAKPRCRRFYFDPSDNSRLTHQLFRFPAKFHPPVAHALLDRYTEIDERVLDPFCGSGTLLVEASTAGRHGVGTDVDPLAVFITAVKSKPLNPAPLYGKLDMLLARLEPLRGRNYEELQWQDLSRDAFEDEIKQLSLPAIPNLDHWFRRYVAVDLARMRHEILGAPISAAQRRFFLACFAAIIRNASNADPVPVSGLEVTGHMRAREAAGRVIDPFALFERAARRAVDDMASYYEAVAPSTKTVAYRADATEVRRHVRKPIQAVITSPPYHGAVDYYRRHQLEMYWLGLTTDHKDRLELLGQYIGRPKVPARHRFVADGLLATPKARRLERRIRQYDPKRADAFKHYCVAMHHTFGQLSGLLEKGAPAVFVVGHSSWNKGALNTSDLFKELAAPDFRLDEYFWYPVRNRYMSYSRRNGASIDREFVLAFRRT